MLKMFWMSALASLLLFCVGCDSAQPTSTVENADQAAIDAYKAAQEADQAAMNASLGTPNTATKPAE